MTTPLMPQQVYEGGSYWAGMGDTRWGAVTITSRKRKSATVDRVNPKNNQTTKRGAKVRLDRLVKRDPKKKGKDKPTIPPSEVFAEVAAPAKPQKPKADAVMLREMQENFDKTGEAAPAPAVTPPRIRTKPRTKADIAQVKKTHTRWRTEYHGYTQEQAEAEWEDMSDW